MIGPGHAPFLQQRRAVPLAHLLAEALRANLAHRQHDMRVRLGLPGLAHVPMYIHVRDPAAFHDLFFAKNAGALGPLLLFTPRWTATPPLPPQPPVLPLPP